MKNTIIKKKRLYVAAPFKSIFFASFTILLICFNSCSKKAMQGDFSPQFQTKTLSLKNSAYAVLKNKADDEVFNDLDWNHVQTSNLNGKPFLLKIKSKSDPTKTLYYSKKKGKVHTRWVQFKSRTNFSDGEVTVSSLNGVNHTISTFKSGKIFAAKRINKNGNVTVLTINKPGSKVQAIETKPALGFGGMLKTMDTNGQEDSDDPADDIDDGDDDATTSVDPPAWEVTLHEVNIVGDNSSGGDLFLYSLFVLMGNDPLYENMYTIDPDFDLSDLNMGFGGTVLTISPTGTKTGIDPTFKPGQTIGTPIMVYKPSALLYGNAVSIGYSVATVNGVSTVTVSTITAGLTGNQIGVAWTTLSTSTSISGSVINFSVSGVLSYGLTYGGTGPSWFGTPTTLSGTYDTSNGHYVINHTE